MRYFAVEVNLFPPTAVLYRLKITKPSGFRAACRALLVLFVPLVDMSALRTYADHAAPPKIAEVEF